MPMKGTETEMGIGLENEALAPTWRPALGIVDKEKSVRDKPSWARRLFKKPDGSEGAEDNVVFEG